MASCRASAASRCRQRDSRSACRGFSPRSNISARSKRKAEAGPVVVTVFDKDRIADYQNMVALLRNAGIRAELYLGSGKFGPQMKYADRRNSPCVVIQGSDEKAKGEVTIKDLIVGAELAKLEKGRDEHLQKQAEAQRAVPEARARRSGARGARAPRTQGALTLSRWPGNFFAVRVLSFPAGRGSGSAQALRQSAIAAARYRAGRGLCDCVVGPSCQFRHGTRRSRIASASGRRSLPQRGRRRAGPPRRSRQQQELHRRLLYRLPDADGVAAAATHNGGCCFANGG